MNRHVTAFILSAGLGERLRPITNHIPKPLLPILGRPVLELILEKVLSFTNTIGINLHHKKGLIAEYINNSPFKDRANIFYEEPILGTGGALKNAEALLSKGSFLVHNGDILSDIDLKRLIEFHKSTKNMATLAVHECPQFNSLEIDGNGFLINVLSFPRKWESRKFGGKDMDSCFRRNDSTRKAFTGIAVYEPEFLKFLPLGVSSVVDAWLRAKDAGYKIGTMDVSGCYWTDIGTPSAYAAAVVNALRVSGETIYIHPDAECGDVEMDGYAAIEKGSTFPRVKSLRNCIILPVLPPHPGPLPQGERELKEISPPLTGGDKGEGEGFSFENCILCQDRKIDLDESEMLGFPKGESPLIGVGGSDRKYYRRRKNKQSEVFVRYAQNDADFRRHIEFTKFFRKHNIPVPELMEVDYENRTAVFEDLGDISLYSWCKCKQGKRQIEEMYRKILHILLELHTTATDRASECPMLQERVFDYEHARWETDYFMKEFAVGVKSFKIKDTTELKDEFHKLAKRVDFFPKAIIHRDFQSQNIMVKKGVPRLIDYQGARMGLPAYDVASILWDPYARLENSARETLLDFYIQQMNKKSGGKFKEADFIEFLKVCRLQRHMQALGAYGFLSSKKGKKYFLKHIPEGLKLLKEDILPVKAEYPTLFELISNLKV
ncbi:MAG: phosphotransferase [Deltaproteobacteria bacterium]|nr:phosphotransferase [Deltaproteobacteria bacterium]